MKKVFLNGGIVGKHCLVIKNKIVPNINHRKIIQGRIISYFFFNLGKKKFKKVSHLCILKKWRRVVSPTPLLNGITLPSDTQFNFLISAL